EIDPRQRLVEIVDVEYDVLLRRRECPEVHEMAVAASLNGDAGCRLMPEVLGHDRGRPAQEGERASKHAFVTHRDQVRHAGAVARGEDGDRIAIGGAEQVGVTLARNLFAQPLALPVAVGARAPGKLGDVACGVEHRIDPHSRGRRSTYAVRTSSTWPFGARK